MKKERGFAINNILSQLDLVAVSVKKNLSSLNDDIVSETYSNKNLDRVRRDMALADVDEQLSSYVIDIAKKKFGINICGKTVADMFDGREEKIIPVRFLISGFKREIFAMDLISYYFIGAEMSANRISDVESISYEVKMAAMEAGFEVDGVFFMNREL